VRDATIKRRITINGLPIMNPADAFNNRYYLDDLDLYYRGCVIGGPGAFYIVANSFKDYARAVRRKLVLEIAGAVPQDNQVPRAVFLKASSNTRLRSCQPGTPIQKDVTSANAGGALSATSPKIYNDR